ncbi:putative amidoligase domain-containing protein [Mechercharimyces sp. CAU 1602]|uniref:putative amidoligase domain-containing protein n=1 Tax=Mechercharimyces sp. CAU 1602 TaxID=2973933 RepID=UPI0021630EB4|nr:hypothetical protein [Mechercharimyces sp. CAU 1602]MCS1351211.1 hypothetical protein [Mechercharimyces sp. CAU 1602]
MVSLSDTNGEVTDQLIRQQMITDDGKLVSSLRIRSYMPYAASIFTLNRKQMVEMYQSREQRSFCFSMHGIAYADDEGGCLSQYVVAVFQTDALLIYKSKEETVWLATGKKTRKPTFQRIAVNMKNRESRHVSTLAVRAIYALGLDYGVVKIGLFQRKKLKVIDVVINPRMNDTIKEAFCEAIVSYINRLPNMTTRPESIMLGADPEFIMRDTRTGEIVFASDYFPKDGKVGCDAIWQGENRENKPLVELRPTPSSDPKKVILRMYQGLLHANHLVPKENVKWLAGGLPVARLPLGGHIHFSGLDLNFPLLRALDQYLALPLVLAEDPRGILRRPRYGFLGDFRRQPHGGFEYRTLPSWLVSPVITCGVMALGQLVASSYPLLRYEPLSTEERQQAYYEGNKRVVGDIIYDIWLELQALEYYPRYEEMLDPYFDSLCAGQVWDETKDFRTMWNISIGGSDLLV